MRMVSRPANPHLPPHLRELCSILAAGMVRLRHRDEEDLERELRTSGESSLHFRSERSVCHRRKHEDVA